MPEIAGEMIAGASRRCERQALPGIDTWVVDLQAVPARESFGALSTDELARAARFKFEGDRRRFLHAHCALRELLARAVSRRPEAIEFLTGPNGKPSLPDAYSIPFNMSHSGEIALVAIGSGLARDTEIGVDVEVMRAVSDSTALAAMNFTVQEQDELRHVAADQRDRAFLQGWTRKEACLKAVGSGLSIAPSTFHCGLHAVRSVAEIETPRGRTFVELAPLDIGADNVASVAIIHPH